MPEEKNIINYTAADIQKYWNGNLSAVEMHAMEKAAMDDPFLADALEGYKNVNVGDGGIDSLKDRLDKRVGAFVPVLNLKRKRFTWVRVAAAIIIIIGAGLLVQQLVFKSRNENSIAILENNDKKSESVANSNPQKPDTIHSGALTISDSGTTKSGQKKSISADAGSYAFTPLDTISKTGDADAALKKTENESVPSGNAQAIASAERKEELAREKADLGRTLDDSTKSLKDNNVLSSPVIVAKARTNQANDGYDRFAGVALNNKFNYRVVDAQNNPVPFANVMNTRDNIGTYTDIRGNFNLVSSDSVLNVQIRSLGYNAANYKLIPSNVQSGDLVLKEDERKETVAQNRKVVSSLSRKDSTEIEEPEVGWSNYNTYAANNIQIPENVRPKNTRSDVELSFDIDKTGQPINIRVIRSSQCKECDQEAIRLLKEGPKWKRKGKKSKATVSINVDK
ncbi:MAG TPA: TonB family protein [Chitinophagaceae bacterium]